MQHWHWNPTHTYPTPPPTSPTFTLWQMRRQLCTLRPLLRLFSTSSDKSQRDAKKLQNLVGCLPLKTIWGGSKYFAQILSNLFAPTCGQLKHSSPRWTVLVPYDDFASPGICKRGWKLFRKEIIWLWEWLMIRNAKLVLETNCGVFFVSSSCKENLQRVDLLCVIKVDVEKSFAS